MKYDKFFTLCKEKGIEEAELTINNSYSVSISLFHSEIDEYAINSDTVISARGIVNGQCGASTTDTWNDKSIHQLVDDILSNASLLESEDKIEIFKGSEKYHRVNTFNPSLDSVPLDDKIKNLYTLEKLIKEKDSRIQDVGGVSYSESKESVTIINSHGLKISQKTNYFVYSGYAVAKLGEQTKSSGDIFLSNDFSTFDVEALADKIVEQAIKQLGGHPCKSKKYKAVLSNDVVSMLLGAYIANACADEVQKGSSLFINKLNTQVASKKVTIIDKPITNNVFATKFDGEGVATFNKPIIKNGVLMTYLHNNVTAKKDGTTSTGNARKSGGKMLVSPQFLSVKPGRKTLEQLLEKMGDGVYITDVSGLHAGLNQQSGNFSLQSTGFLVENGKLSHGLDVITVSGNLLDIFKDVVDVGSDIKLTLRSNETPSLLIKKLIVSGE
ncbi:MAG: TldD/PmbA family protein [Bacilli bacterium]